MMDIKRIKKKLTPLFAQNNLNQLEANDWELLKDCVGRRKFREIVADQEYQQLFEALKKIRDDLDQILEGEKEMQQVKACLDQLHHKTQRPGYRELPFKEADLFAELVQQGIYNDWDNHQKEYFDFGRQMICKWDDYFISYTNRNLHETNDDFKEIIPAVLGQPFFDKYKTTCNCVPHIIVHYLRNEGLIGFFDKKNLTLGDILRDELFEHCTGVFSFVQLLETESFKYEEDETNWCYLEFKTFTDWTQQTGKHEYKRHFYIIPDSHADDVVPVVLHPEFETWKKNLSDRIYISKLSTLEKKEIKIQAKKMAKEIVGIKSSIIKDYCS